MSEREEFMSCIALINVEIWNFVFSCNECAVPFIVPTLCLSEMSAFECCHALVFRFITFALICFGFLRRGFSRHLVRDLSTCRWCKRANIKCGWGFNAPHPRDSNFIEETYLETSFRYKLISHTKEWGSINHSPHSPLIDKHDT